MKKQSCEEKIKKYLLKQPVISFFKKNDSGSEYYQCYHSLIRLSDHIPYRINLPEILNIIVNKDTFAILYGGKLINLNDYDEFKKFIKHFILIQEVTTASIKSHYNKVENAECLIPKDENIINYIRFKGQLFNVSNLTCKQINNINNRIKANQICSNKELITAINNSEKELGL